MTDHKNRGVLILPSEMGKLQKVVTRGSSVGEEDEERRLGVDAQGMKEAVAAIYGVERGDCGMGEGWRWIGGEKGVRTDLGERRQFIHRLGVKDRRNGMWRISRMSISTAQIAKDRR